MYNDTIKVANKIIKAEDLFDIFSAMNEKLVKYRRIYEKEKQLNENVKYSDRKWTFEDYNSRLKFSVNFYDDTEITFDNYNNFISIYNSRLHEIKNIYVYFRLSYSKHNAGENSFDSQTFNQHIDMTIKEDKMSIEVSLSSIDRIMDDIYELIKRKILNAPERFDYVIKKRSHISNIVGIALGFIPAIIITTILLFFPSIREVFAQTYIIYPICCLILLFFIGKTLSTFKLDRLYQNIIPEKKYAGYDKQNYKSIYKDDMDKYLSTSEILIGKNVENILNRKRIMEYYNHYKRFIPFEIMILALMSVVVIFLGGN